MPKKPNTNPLRIDIGTGVSVVAVLLVGLILLSDWDERPDETWLQIRVWPSSFIRTSYDPWPVPQGQWTMNSIDEVEASRDIFRRQNALGPLPSPGTGKAQQQGRPAVTR